MGSGSCLQSMYTGATLASVQADFDFDSFTQAFQAYHGGALATPSDAWLQWFIGFYEGDGSLHVSSKHGSVVLTVVQNWSDLDVLENIRSTLGVGTVVPHNTLNETWRYRVESKQGMELLLNLLNGNMVVPTKILQFQEALTSFNEWVSRGSLLLPQIMLKTTVLLPSLTTAWLAGFSDAEGCFSCSFLSNSSHAFRLRFLLAQKYLANRPVLLAVLGLFGAGKVLAHHVPDVYEYVLGGVKNTESCFSYFDQYTLRTRKAKSYRMWRELHSAIKAKQHLDPVRRAELKTLASTVNKIQA